MSAFKVSRAEPIRPAAQIGGASPTDPLARLTAPPGRAARITHVEHVPARIARPVRWPDWVDPAVVDGLRAGGISTPWAHQALAADHAWAGRSVVVATGTASGKSLAYLLPTLTAARNAEATVLYVAPTKALAADQLRTVVDLHVPGVWAATFDGDTPVEARDAARDNANFLLTNPDMLHRSLLPRHHRWVRFFRSLRYVVIDECHSYRGVFGSHVAQVLRRLRRVCAGYGAQPVFVLASATVSDPAASAERLTGLPTVAVTDDASPRGQTAFALWEPPLLERPTDEDRRSAAGPSRRSSVVETADLLADLVVEGVRTVAFVRSRRAAETVAVLTREKLGQVDPELARRVAAYRAGYLPHERRSLEADLRSGRLLGVAATNALELGVDVIGLDAVLLAGWPGTLASLWQQAGRAGRAGEGALAVLVARDDPLDTYLVHHPQAIFGRPVEATVLDPDNPYVLAPHLCAAAREVPLTEADLDLFGPAALGVVSTLEDRRLLRRRAGGWYWTRRDRPVDLVDLRGPGGQVVRLVEERTGRLLGTVDPSTAHATVHTGAVYVHQGETHVVQCLDLDEAVAFVERIDPGYTTTARDVSDIRLVGEERGADWGDARLSFGTVEVSSQVTSFVKRRSGSGDVLGEVPLDLPERHLRTKAVWWTLTDEQVAKAEVSGLAAAGAAHAAEHASIGLLPLFATCDRWDIGGVSTARHPDTGLLTVFVHDGHPGGAGFAERGFHAARAWLSATRAAIAGCECTDGCPSCVQSPKCGNGNEPLDKAGAVRVLDVLLEGAGNIRPEAGPEGPARATRAGSGRIEAAAPDNDTETATSTTSPAT